MGTRGSAVPTLATLQEAEDLTQMELMSLISEFSREEFHTAQQLRSSIAEVKQARGKFERASGALSSWYIKAGSMNEAAEVRETRLRVVYTECREHVQLLNSLIRESGEEVESSIGGVSRCQSLCAMPRIGRESPENIMDSDPGNAVDPLPTNLSFASPERPVTPPPLVCEPHQHGAEKTLNGQPIEDVLPEVRVKELTQDVETLDPFSRRQLRQELLKGLGEPFDGDPQYFWCWQQQISRRLLEAEVGPLDSMYVLKANTMGRPRKLVSDRLIAGSSRPRETLLKVWQDLKKRFGDNALVSDALMMKVRAFTPIKGASSISHLEDLLDLCRVVLANKDHCSELRLFDLQSGMKIVWEKLPETFQTRWRREWHRNLRKTGANPVFADFVDFLEEFVDELGLPNFQQARLPTSGHRHVRTLHTEAVITCRYHNTGNHSILDCDAFRRLPVSEKKKFAVDNRLCFACLGEHRRSDCTAELHCSECGSKHATVMHGTIAKTNSGSSRRQILGNLDPSAVNSGGPNSVGQRSTCTSICGSDQQTRVCSKTLLVELRAGEGAAVLRCWCILDEQSNSSFCDPKVPTYFGIEPCKQTYQLSTMSGMRSVMEGGVVDGLEIRGVGSEKWIRLPTLMTSECIPDSTGEVATSDMVLAHPHIRHLARNFPKAVEQVDVLILVGADCGEAMVTKSYGRHYPFAHRTALGWALVGPVCKRSGSGVPSKSLKCLNEHLSVRPIHSRAPVLPSRLANDPFLETSDDDLLSPSRDEQKFVEIIGNGVTINEKGNLEMPLPFKQRWNPPDNRSAVLRRTKNTLHRVCRDAGKLSQCLGIMGNYISRGHVEEVPTRQHSATPSNYIPVFPVQNPRKEKLRIVFDSSASFQGQCLNDFLLQGPDENNGVVGVLTRFRHGQYGFSADVECMFHSFYVAREDRDYMRFFWWKENDPQLPLVPYRANVHVFGNTSSPAVATFGLRYCTTLPLAQHHPKACEFLRQNCYVDDALGATDTVQEAIDILKATQDILNGVNVRLHKIAANDPAILSAFEAGELSPSMSTHEVHLTTHKTLGVLWRIADDKFVLRPKFVRRNFTKRGVLSTLNSLYDPLGLVAPITLGGRLLQREIIPPKERPSDLRAFGWDDELPETYRRRWEDWTSSSSADAVVHIPRSFTPPDFGAVAHREIHTFCDASKDAIGHVIYLRSTNLEGRISVSFVGAGSKVSPRAATSIPRLELCGALEASRSTNHYIRELDKPINSVTFHCDSRVVLGYIKNSHRQFSRYVTSRLQDILKTSSPDQWQYVSTSSNTADLATRPQTPDSLMKSDWFTGPHFLWVCTAQNSDFTPLLEEDLPETITVSKSLSTSTENTGHPANLIFTRTSSWKRAKRIMASIHHFGFKILRKVRNHPQQDFQDSAEFAEKFLIREAQKESFPQVYRSLSTQQFPSGDKGLDSLAPFLDSDKIIRVGGRLRHSKMEFGQKHPILLPPKHPITALIFGHFHRAVYHQGRHITMGALQQGGYHIHRARNVVRKFLENCVVCKRLRGASQVQMMADLPPDRLEECPPFTNTGMDVFGPYPIHDGTNTRRSKATKKLWGLLFTCLTSRAVHIEPLTALDVSSLHLALRRFLAIRGQCRKFRSDHGSNFVAARTDLRDQIDIRGLQASLDNLGCQWELTTPAASHQGGVWERKIGSVKSVLNSVLLQLRNAILSRDELCTLFQEAVAIVNNTPLYELSADPNDPVVITPAMLLTLKDSPNPPSPDTFTTTDLLQYGRARWRRVMYLAEQFWGRWRRNYVSSLHERNKWSYPKRRACINDVVLVKQSSSRNTWPIARVKDIKINRDGLPRTLVLQFPSNKTGTIRTLRRSVQDTILLVPNEAT